MDVARPWLALVLIAILAADATACAIPIQYVKNDLDRLGCSAAIQRAIPVVKMLAVAGLVIGLWVTWLGAFACIAMLAYFAVAFWYHARNNDSFDKYLPAAAFALFILATLVFSYLG